MVGYWGSLSDNSFIATVALVYREAVKKSWFCIPSRKLFTYLNTRCGSTRGSLICMWFFLFGGTIHLLCGPCLNWKMAGVIEYCGEAMGWSRYVIWEESPDSRTTGLFTRSSRSKWTVQTSPTGPLSPPRPACFGPCLLRAWPKYKRKRCSSSPELRAASLLLPDFENPPFKTPFENLGRPKVLVHSNRVNRLLNEL